MADTRCADPELQLDVDLMILEYALYHATKARLEALQAEDEGRNGEATRLVLVFDTFIRLFNQNHPEHVKSAQLLFNLKILEFLVLLSAGPAKDFSDVHAHSLRKEASQSRETRQRWLDLRHTQAQQPGWVAALSKADLSYSIERQIYAAWDHSVHNEDASSDDSAGSLFHLLPRFMEISAEIASLLSGDPNESWMNIACEFMLQASVESLRSQVGIGVGGDRPGLEECFGWGFINYELATPSISHNHYDLEVAINELFRRSSDNPDEVLQEEDPLWRDVRAQYLSEFSIADDASVQSQGWRLDRLTQKYPPNDFHDNLVNYIEKVWEHHCECCGIPVLAEIEQGHIRSLQVEGQEFDNFMVNVGLRKDSSGLLKFKL
jgi:hypothetical protein